MFFLFGENENWGKAGDAVVKELKTRNVDVEYWMAPSKGRMFFESEPWLTV